MKKALEQRKKESLFELFNRAKEGSYIHRAKLLEEASRLGARLAAKALDSDAAQDVGQETAIRMHKHFDGLGFTSSQAVGSWIKLTSSRLVADHFKDKAVSKKYQSKVEALEREWMENSALKPDEGSDEQAAIVRQVVEHLHPDLRAIVELKYFHGLKDREIAERLDIPIGTVKSRNNRATNTLRPGLQLMLGIKD